MENKKQVKQLSLLGSYPRLLLVVLFSMVASFAFAQNKSVSGSVVDAKGEPIIGASVLVKGTSNGTISDMDGNFSLKNVPNNATLQVSFIGYVAQTISVAGKNTIKVVLQENSQVLEEVVVVGYGTAKKSDVTGAMARVGDKELKAMPVKDAFQAMQGKVAGVDITSNQRPGETGSIKIRGVRSLSADNDPLCVVDGMVIQSGGIDNINPSDIESIDILKDASATAIYGSRGANGVILVTTKHGKEGKISLNYSGSVTMEKMYDVTEYMDAAEWLDYARLAKYNIGTYKSATPSYAADYAAWGSVAASFANIAKAWTDNNTVYDRTKVGNFDWSKYGKQTGISTEHTLSASGGTDKFQGYGSFGYLRQEGTQPGELFQRYTAKTSFDASPLKWFKMGTSMNLSWGDQDYGYNFAKSVTGAGDLYSALKGMLPWTVPYDENGDYIRNPAAGDVNIINPINELKYTVNNRKTLRAAGSFYAQMDLGELWAPLKGLKVRTQFGPEFKYYRTGTFYDKRGINGDGNNTATYNNYQTLAWTLDNLMYYDRTIAKDHKIGLTLMQSSSASHYEYGTMKALGVATASELWYNMSSVSSLNSFGTGLTESQMESYMMRANYSFKDRYLLTASIRWDGASRLADGNKWSSFPSLALGWRIDQESFMKDIKWVDALKLRLGVGTTGNSAVPVYGTKGGVSTLYYNWGATTSSIGYVASDPSQASPAKMANPKLGWERTTQYNLGLDYGFLKGRINGNIDVYKTQTNDLLMAMSIPSLTGYTSTYANVGKTEGWGIDLQINTVNVKTKDFTWTTGLTWSKDKSKITELANGNKENIGSAWFVGKEIGVFYDWVYDGIWKTSEATEAAKYGRQPGQIKVKDLNKDGKIDANNDKKIVGSIRPAWSGGMTNTFNYMNLELSFFIYTRWGSTFKGGAVTLDGRYMQRKVDYWVAGTNENAKYYSPGSTKSESADTYNSAMNYQDGSFIKVRNINLGYNFSQKQLKSIGFSSLKVYAQCMNPFMIYKKCDFLDTDLSSYDNNTVTTGSATTTRGLVFGVNVGF
ncbi:TonB-linked outer membrane protein, SusC/RagA family [Bacteroides luti]|uniref:TonB-linked outer membrane protein, SusC/RagA family n=1 Tax=Bacteroides luti TaxID=1297750 RepID=A0A1M4UQN1_9BACE|nr:TonB-dependent receptor [Bacteroides luti]SHE58913.1 TonB-linked outer membrane protein, SusC/RagA family [Bacteroides luti]